MKILVTGANGFLGSAVTERLLDRQGNQLTCLVRPGSRADRIEGLSKAHPHRVHIYRGTLNRIADCRRILQEVDVIHHLAAATGGSAAEMFLNNSVATRNLLDSVVESGRAIKVVHCSSFSVYGAADIPRGGVVDERTPLETLPQNRDIYAFSKLHQEIIVAEYHRHRGIPTVILRPGVIYGPGGVAISPRVGLNLFGLFLHFGRDNQVPLSYVENCAEAFAHIGETALFNGEVYNILDDEIITSRQFLEQYCKKVKNIRFLTLSYPVVWLLSLVCEKYHTYSKGQLPAIFTRYKTANMWKGHRYSNAKLRKKGWQQIIPAAKGFEKHFSYLARHLPESPK